MSRQVRKLLLVFAFIFSMQARPDLFGGDVAVLSQILVNNIQQLTQLMAILKAGQRQVELLEDVRQEVFRTIDAIHTVSSLIDPGTYKDWASVEYALRQLESEYGIAVPSPNYQVERDADQSIAEAITLNNKIYEYSRQLDEAGERIKRASESVSPGAAQKVTAHSQGIMLHAMNQSLRAQATLIKLQAQSMALKNREEKQLTKNQVASSQEMERMLRAKKKLFTLPRF